jgi:putative transport protein
MEIIYEQLRNFPFITLFLTLGLGFLAGKFKIGKFQLGGIAGTLIIGVLLGQVGGIHVSEDVKNVFFSLFIFMVGYLGGPQFFASLKPSSVKYLAAALGMTILGLIAVLGVSKWAGLDAGLSAGLAAGGLTQSAIIGTAGNAIDQLGLAAKEAKDLKTNVAVGYSITYIFGSIGPILMVSFIAIVMKWDIRKEAIKLATKLGGSSDLAEGEFEPLSRISTRAYKINDGSKFINKTVKDLEEEYDSELTVENIIIDNKSTDSESSMVIEKGNVLIICGLVSAFSEAEGNIGKEISEFGGSKEFTEEVRRIIVTNKDIHGLTLNQLHEKSAITDRHGAYISSINRMDKPLPVLKETEIHKGDEIDMVGKKKDLDKVQKIIGYKAPSINTTEFITFGIGMVVGYLIGEIGFTIDGTNVSLGSGLGCLVSGLIIGFMRTRYPKIGSVNTGAANFLQSFGLAVFVGVVGLNAGEPALEAIKEHGVTLLLLGVVVTMIPMIIQFFLNYTMFKIKNPIEALGVLTGSKSANPGYAALLEKAGNSTGTPTFTMTYAVANIFLTLWGPIIVAIMS